jgi:hypothetical protein
MAILSIPVPAAFDNTTAATGRASASTTETVTVSFSPPGVRTVSSLKLTGKFDATSNIQNLTGAMYTTPDGAIFNISLTFFQPKSGFDLAASSIRVDHLWGVVLSGDDWFNLGAQADSVSLYAGDDYVDSGEGNDTITGGAGNDTLNGNTGIDTAVYTGTRASFTLATSGNNFIVTDLTGAEGVDTLVNIERIVFADKSVALDVEGNAGQAYRIYQAAFARKPDNGGLKYWIGMMDSGTTLEAVSSGFIGSAEFKNLYGANPTNDQFVSKLYNNVLGRAPDAGGFNYWVGLLNNKQIDMTSTLVNFSESTENKAAVIGVIQNGIELI